MTTTKEYVRGHYKLEEVPYGKVYRWTAGHALVEGECGQLMLVEHASTAICPECGADHTGALEGLEGRSLIEDEVYYPEHLAYEWRRREQEAHLRYREYADWSELRALE
jgi:hypothetical protein